MRTALEIKNDYAKSKGYSDWNDLYQKSFVFPGVVDDLINEAREEAIEECRENVYSTIDETRVRIDKMLSESK